MSNRIIIMVDKNHPNAPNVLDDLKDIGLEQIVELGYQGMIIGNLDSSADEELKTITGISSIVHYKSLVN
jgi:hypothetical protein